MENKIMPTAEEFIQNFIIKSHKPHSLNDRGNAGSNTEWLMIEFAKLHVEAALEAASKSSKVRKDTYVMGRGTTEVEQMFNYSNGTSHYVDQVSILNSYPLENIK